MTAWGILSTARINRLILAGARPPRPGPAPTNTFRGWG